MQRFKLDPSPQGEDEDTPAGIEGGPRSGMRTPEQASAAIADAYAEVVDVGLLALDPVGVITTHNQRFARLCDLPAPGFARRTLAELVGWLLQRDELSVAIAQLLASEHGRVSAGEIVTSDGRAVRWRRALVDGDQGSVWSLRDTSEERQMAAALVDAAGWLRMLEAHTDGVLLELDAEARIVGLWGPSQRFFDVPDGVLQGKTLLDAIPGPEGLALDARVRHVLASSFRQDYECCLDVAGTKRVVSTSAVLMRLEEEEPLRVTLMMRDVTERAHVQAKLLQVERLASVGLLAAGVAHEINNPLAYLLLNLQRVRSRLKFSGTVREEAREEIESALDMSIEGGSRVQAIVQDLKRFSHPDHDELLPVDVHRSLDFAIAMAEPELQGHARLTRDYGALPAVRGSEARLSQIFLNLIINAAHALHEAGHGRGQISVVTRTHPTGGAMIEVHDTGRGISSAALRHVFEPFYTTKPPGLGTGLGLTICRDIVRSLGGRIEVDSQEGYGSVFRVVLPPAVLAEY